MSKYALEPKNYAKLVKFAQLNGLDAKHGVTKSDDLIAMIKDVFPDLTEIELDDGDAEVALVKGANRTTAGDPTHYSHDPKVVVNIASDPANGGSYPWPLTCNGDLILVKRDTDVAIPYRHYQVLATAVENVLRQEMDRGTQQFVTIESPQNAVRFSVRTMPSRDEIDAYNERCRNIRAGMKKAA